MYGLQLGFAGYVLLGLGRAQSSRPGVSQVLVFGAIYQGTIFHFGLPFLESQPGDKPACAALAWYA